MIFLVGAFIAAAIVQYYIDVCDILFQNCSLLIDSVIFFSLQRDITEVPVRLGTQVYNGFSCPITIDDQQTLESNQVWSKENSLDFDSVSLKIIPWSCENLFFTSFNITSNCDGRTASFTYPVGSPCPSAVIIHSGNFSEAPVDLAIQTIPVRFLFMKIIVRRNNLLYYLWQNNLV